MEELTEALATSFAVSNDPCSTAAAHPRFAQYKSRSSTDQNQRRQKFLEEQKERRYDFVNLARNLAEDAWEEADAEEEMEAEEEVLRLKKPGRYFKNQLMLSEWLVEVPADFTDEWLMVLCPVGKRCLVVASNGKTCAYAKSGYKVNSFPSHLPGGNRSQSKRSKESAILDCLYSEVEGAYYVLDLMSWREHPVYDSETEFRSYWLQTKFQEMPEVGIKSAINPYKFFPLPSFPCTSETIGRALASANFQIDGVLFYHKRTHYTFGSTPLVVWLKPYMVKEILNIPVPEHMMAEMPASYTNYADHMENVANEKAQAEEKKAKELEEKKAEKSSAKNTTEESMDSDRSGRRRRGRGRGRKHDSSMEASSGAYTGRGDYGGAKQQVQDPEGVKADTDMEVSLREGGGDASEAT